MLGETIKPRQGLWGLDLGQGILTQSHLVVRRVWGRCTGFLQHGTGSCFRGGLDLYPSGYHRGKSQANPAGTQIHHSSYIGWNWPLLGSHRITGTSDCPYSGYEFWYSVLHLFSNTLILSM